MENEKKPEKVRRVGTFTLGCMLIFFGILFIVHMFVPELSYEWILRLWPLILISLGTEVLICGFSNSEKRIYDGGAVFLLIVLTFFSMGMAVICEAGQYLEMYVSEMF